MNADDQPMYEEDEDEERPAPEPVAFCPVCGIAWYALTGYCGGCGEPR